MLSSAATKRDAKAYLSRLKNPTKKRLEAQDQREARSGSYVNVGALFRGSRAAEMSPVFTQQALAQSEFQEEETIHVALVKVKDVASLAQSTLEGIGETLSQLNRLSISPIVVVESSFGDRGQLSEETDRLVEAINREGDFARRVDNVFTVSEVGKTAVHNRKLLLRPLRRSRIPVLGNVAYYEDEQKMCIISAKEAVLALTEELAGLSVNSSTVENHNDASAAVQDAQRQVSLDRIITIDSAGGIPNAKAADGRHVFLNLEQEYDLVKRALQAKVDSPATDTHLSNLGLLKEALALLPPSSSGLMTTYEEAANYGMNTQTTDASGVGTRRQKNALIHNILTDKPAYSSSLPSGRLPRADARHDVSNTISYSSFVKRGMAVTIFPNPFESPWRPPSGQLKLTDARIDLARLVHLIEDSFDRKLDVEHYLKRVNDRIAGVIVAGEYEGCAILTWEVPPSSSGCDAEPVPYLDKFAVLKRSQGAGGVADIVFNAMVRSCFPDGVCWRSRKNNPVNKWYFERSAGTWKLPGQNWTMFWTTPNVELHSDVFKSYEGVCRSVLPSWADSQKPAD